MFNPLKFLFKEGEGEAMGAAGIIFGIVVVLVSIIIYYFGSGSTWELVVAAVLAAYGLYHVVVGAMHLNPVTNTAMNIASSAQDAYSAVKGAGKKRTPRKPKKEKSDYNAELWDKTDYENDGSSLDKINEDAMERLSNVEDSEAAEIADEDVVGGKIADTYNDYNDYEKRGGGVVGDAAKWAFKNSGVDPTTIMRTAITSVESYNPAVRDFLNKARDGIHDFETGTQDLCQRASTDPSLKPLADKLQNALTLINHLEAVLP